MSLMITFILLFSPLAPPDPYLQNRLESNKKQPMQRLFAKKEKDVRQYLRNDRKVLRFYAVSELPYYPLGCKGEQKYVIHYYLSDDTLEVRELRSLEEPKGAGTFPKFLKRQKVPKGPAARPKSKIHSQYIRNTGTCNHSV